MLGIVTSGLYVGICLLLLFVVLLQQGKGGDIAAAFGGSGSQAAFGARAGATHGADAGNDGARRALHGRCDRPGHPGRTRSWFGPERRRRTAGGASGGRTGRGSASRASPGHLPRGTRLVLGPHTTRPRLRKWRNWQTHQLEGLAVATHCGGSNPPFRTIDQQRPIPWASFDHKQKNS